MTNFWVIFGIYLQLCCQITENKNSQRENFSRFVLIQTFKSGLIIFNHRSNVLYYRVDNFTSNICSQVILKLYHKQKLDSLANTFNKALRSRLLWSVLYPSYIMEYNMSFSTLH